MKTCKMLFQICSLLSFCQKILRQPQAAMLFTNGILEMIRFHTSGISMRWIGSITAHLNIRVGSSATNPSPMSMESHIVSRTRLRPRMTTRLAGSTFFHVISFQ